MSLFGPLRVSRIKAEHVFEHLTLEEAVLAAYNCFHYLQPGGLLRIAIPDYQAIIHQFHRCK